MDGANPSILGPKALGMHLMTLTILDPWRCPAALPADARRLPQWERGVFSTQNIIRAVGYERDPHKVPFKYRSCSKWMLTGCPRWYLETGEDGRNRPTVRSLQRFK